MLSPAYLRTVPLPQDLTNTDIFTALAETEAFFTQIRTSARINLSEIIQANNFSGVVSNVFTKKLSDASVYHACHDQRYPDLMHESAPIGLEVKASNKPMKGGEGHNGHSGWHIVICYHIQPIGDIEFTHVEIADLNGFGQVDSDWKCYRSKRNKNDSQRTETYMTNATGTAKLRDGSVYLNPEYVIITPHLRRIRKNLSELLLIPSFSPFANGTQAARDKGSPVPELPAAHHERT